MSLLKHQSSQNGGFEVTRQLIETITIELKFILMYVIHYFESNQ